MGPAGTIPGLEWYGISRIMKRPRVKKQVPALPGVPPVERPESGVFDGPAHACFETISIRPGIKMVIANHANRKGFRAQYDIGRAPVSFSYNLSRGNRCLMTCGPGKKKILERMPGDSLVAYLPETTSIVDIPPGEPVVGVSVHFSVPAFRELFHPYISGSGTGFPGHEILSGAIPFYRQSCFGRETAFILKQILDCPYQGDIKRLFLEAKSLELAVLKLAETGAAPCRAGRALTRADQNRMHLDRSDRDRIRQAYQILTDNIEHPPGLEELGRKVGINRNKLNRGFRQIYGNTVFNVLRNLRLARAWSLLLHTDLSLAEIAFSVGYNSQSNFTAAFSRQWGKTPGSVRQGCPAPPVKHISLP